MRKNSIVRRRRSSAAAWIGCALALSLGQGSVAQDGTVFLRGDVNSDGKVSLADTLMLRRKVFLGEALPCKDAGDVDENGLLDIADEVILTSAIFSLNGYEIPAPFPEPGTDPTPDDSLDCASYDPTPPPHTDDVVRIASIDGCPGQEVEIPVYIKSSVDVEAVQLVMAYDPAVFAPATGGYKTFNFEGTPWEVSFEDRDCCPVPPDSRGNMNTAFGTLRAHPAEGFFVVGIIGSWIFDGYVVPAGPEQLAFRIRGRVADYVPPGTTIPLEFTNGPDDQGVLPPFLLRNELIYKGVSRYVSVLPLRVSGSVCIVKDIAFFTRGDANWDGGVDISDASFLLNHLFLGGQSPRCEDAADADDNGRLEITDGIVILNGLFTLLSTIAEPYPRPGLDPTFDNLTPCPRSGNPPPCPR